MIVATLLLTATMVFAASQSPEEKGKEYAKKCVQFVMSGDMSEMEEMNELGYRMGEYIESLSEDGIERFLTAFIEGVYYYCDVYDLGDAVAEEFLTSFYSAMLGELE